MTSLFLGYFFVDPAREMFPFVLPILGRPILWYGFLFALGFLIGYFILSHILRRSFLKEVDCKESDITDYSVFLSFLQKPSCEVSRKLREMFLARLEEGQKLVFSGCTIQQPFPPAFIKPLLATVNAFLEEEECKSKESSWVCKIPDPIFNVAEKRRAQNLLCLEKAFPRVFVTVKSKVKSFAESLTFYVMVGAVVGARLGDVLFYQNWKFYLSHPLSLIKIWEGGLASHGGAIGIAIALALFCKKKKGVSWIQAIDLCVIPTAFAAACIRIGNFMNQEILGTPTTLPWAVAFGHPVDGLAGVPRHPVQLYEAFFYLTLGIALYFLWKKNSTFLEKGRLSGAFLTLVFAFRFGIEFVKEEQSVWTHAFLHTGQYLSIPCMLLGVYLLFQSTKLGKKLFLKRKHRKLF